MSDSRRDQGTPLFPRRTLSGPDPSKVAEAGGPTGSRGSSSQAARSGNGPVRDDGPPTAALPRVDERAPAAKPPTPAAQPSRPPAGHGDQASEHRPEQAGAQRGSTVLSAPDQPRQRGKGPRKARLRIARLDPWSVMKMAFALSIALAVVTVVAVAIVWSVLDTAGVWESINTGVDTLANPDAGDRFDVREYVGLGRVMGLTMVVSLANVVLLTALATLGAFIYNLAAALLGGFEVTLAEDR